MGSGGFVPEGHLTIARRFNAGEARKGILVPKGRLRILLALSRPFGTGLLFRFAHPALKRRAIFGSPSGAKSRRELTDSSNRTLRIIRQSWWRLGGWQGVAARKRGVAVSRQSAAGDGFRIWRPSGETPLRKDGSAAFTEALLAGAAWCLTRLCRQR